VTREWRNIHSKDVRHFVPFVVYYCHVYGVTADWVCTGNGIPCTLWHAQLMSTFIDHCLTQTVAHGYVFAVVSLPGSCFQRRMFPFLCVSGLFPCLSYSSHMLYTLYCSIHHSSLGLNMKHRLCCCVRLLSSPVAEPRALC
jgi:hypothetical protein